MGLKGDFKMDEELLQTISKSLTHLVYKNTIVEDLHAEGANLDDKTMKIINQEVNNRIYTLLNWYFSEKEEDRDFVAQLVSFAGLFGSNWDKAEMLKKEDFLFFYRNLLFHT